MMSRLHEAQERHAKFYEDTLNVLSTLYEEKGEAIQECLERFEADWANIRAGQAWANAHADEDIRACALCADYANSATHFFTLRFHPSEEIAWAESGLSAVRRRGNPEIEVSILTNLGSAWAALGNQPKAIEYHEQALSIARQIGDRKKQGWALNNLGNAYQALNQYIRAIELYKSALVVHHYEVDG